MSDLLTRARIKAGMLRMGEPIAFGSDADMIDDLVAEVQRVGDAVERISAVAAGRDSLDGFPRGKDEKQRRLAEIYEIAEGARNG